MKPGKLLLSLWALLPFCTFGQSTTGLAVHPIASLTSEDYSDLHFLTEDLKEKQYVFLGEFNHGVHEFQQVKVRLIKYLHEELGYNFIAIEDYLDLYSAHDRLKDTVLLLSATSHYAWQGEEMIELMQYVNANPELRLIGFDVPYYTDSTYAYIKWKIKQTAPELYDEFYKVAGDDLDYLGKCWKPDNAYDYAAGKQKAIDANTRLIEKLKEAWKSKPLSDSCQIVLRFLENRIFFIKSSEKGDDIDSFYFRARDRYMAENLEWIFNDFAPYEKIIVLSHNMHINKVKPTDKYYWTPDEVVGAQLDKGILNKSFVIALNAYQGQYYHGNAKDIYNVGERKKGIEKELHELGYKYCLLDLRQSTGKLPKVSYRERSSFKMDLAEAYDAILFIDTVSAKKVVE